MTIPILITPETSPERTTRTYRATTLDGIPVLLAHVTAPDADFFDVEHNHYKARNFADDEIIVAEDGEVRGTDGPCFALVEAPEVTFGLPA